MLDGHALQHILVELCEPNDMNSLLLALEQHWQPDVLDDTVYGHDQIRHVALFGQSFGLFNRIYG